MKSRLCCFSLKMTVSEFLERLPVISRECPQLAAQFADVARSFSGDDVVRVSLNGSKLVVDFLTFSKG